MDGFIIGYKPKGMTSFSFCNKIRKKLNVNKVGHCGTLDPNAEGVMILGINTATKMMKFFDEHEKTYVTRIVFGYDSKTLDMDSEITKDIKMDVNMADLKEKLAILKEKKTQLPPMISSIKVNGRKLYQYAVKNIDVEVKERDVNIISYEILSDLEMVDNHFEIDIKLEVSKGYYIRSFARDLGSLLGGCAIVKELKRVAIDKYDESMSVTLDNITKDVVIKPWDFFKYEIIDVDDYIAKLCKNGVILDERQTNTISPFYVRNNDKIIALYEPIEDNKYKIVALFGD
ncbi:MAG: tRNA pseudouridine(55) synthase TruB [Acholeplasmatales bacterium]|nr:tRNA pseudouridine(55) synthase TruB [Acholeplasmatales bacterium]